MSDTGENEGALSEEERDRVNEAIGTVEEMAPEDAVPEGNGEASPLEPNDPEAPPVDTEAPIVTEAAFVVFIRSDGRWVADSELVNRPLAVGRKASLNDMYIACANVQKDIMTMDIAQQTVMEQQKVAAAMAQQMQGQAMLEQMRREGKIGGNDGGVLDLSTLQGGPNRAARRHPN